MDLSSISIVTWITLFVVVSLVALHFNISRYYGTLEALGIPCEKPLPFIGSMGKDLFSVIHECDIRLHKKFGPYFGYYEIDCPTIRISDPEMIREVFIKQFSNFSDNRHTEGFSDPIMDKFLSVLRSEEWRQKRNILAPAFTSSKIKHMTPLIDKCAIHLLKLIDEKSKTGKSFEAKSIFSTYLVDVMAVCGFGLNLNTQIKGEKFVKYAKLFTVQPSILLATFILGMPVFLRKYFFFPILKKSNLGLAFFKKLSYDIIKIRQKSQKRRNDVLQMSLDCLTDQDDMKNDIGSPSKTNEHIKPTSRPIFTMEDVVASTIQFLFTGYETAATTLSFLAYCLATNQECQDNLLDEVDRVLARNEGKLGYDMLSELQYMEMAILETIRIYPVLNRIGRECLKTTKISDLTVPKDVHVIVSVYPMHHDAELYPEPEKFDPERFSPENKDRIKPYTYLGFGVGPRACPGKKFAMLQLKLTLIKILKDYRFTSGPDTQIPLKFVENRTVLIPKGDIRIYVEKRSNTA